MERGVTALMMTAWFVQCRILPSICAKAILNLVCAPLVIKDWLLTLMRVKSGHVSSPRLPEEQTMGVCPSIFCTISAHGLVGRAASC